MEFKQFTRDRFCCVCGSSLEKRLGRGIGIGKASLVPPGLGPDEQMGTHEARMGGRQDGQRQRRQSVLKVPAAPRARTGWEGCKLRFMEERGMRECGAAELGRAALLRTVGSHVS